jgi:3-methyladenine DNA glycosylase AlkD
MAAEHGSVIFQEETMTAEEIVCELESLAKPSIKSVLLKHGIAEPLLGVKIEDLKKIQKRVKMDYQLALDLYDTGIYDAMYLAGLIADDRRMTKRDLKKWVKNATSVPMCGSVVSWVAAESLHGWDLALEWIESSKEPFVVSGWTTLSSLVAIKDDAELDLVKLEELIHRVQSEIHDAPNGVRYAMNSYVISVGSYVKSLTEVAIKAAKKIGKVSVDFGETSCKVPFAPEYIEKVRTRGTIGKKRKTAKC